MVLWEDANVSFLHDIYQMKVRMASNTPQNNWKKRCKPNLWTWLWGCPSNLVPQPCTGCGRSMDDMEHWCHGWSHCLMPGSWTGVLQHPQDLRASKVLRGSSPNAPRTALRALLQLPSYTSEHPSTPKSSTAARHRLIGLLFGWVSSGGTCINTELVLLYEHFCFTFLFEALNSYNQAVNHIYPPFILYKLSKQWT